MQATCGRSRADAKGKGQGLACIGWVMGSSMPGMGMPKDMRGMGCGGQAWLAGTWRQWPLLLL